MTFNQVGLPPDTEWSLSFAGVAQKSAAPSITFSAKRGTHEYAVTELLGYTAVPPSGVVEVGKDPANLKITFMAKPSQPRSSDPDGSVQSSEPAASASAGATPPSKSGPNEPEEPAQHAESGPSDSAGAAQPSETPPSDPPSPARAAESETSDPASPAPPPESGSMDPAGPAP
jgi:hypothetical protein